MSEPSQPETLADTLRRYEIELPNQMVTRLDEYRRLLWETNEKINLTRHTDVERFVTRDVVDSLQLAELLEPEERILDVGTGGGVPGVVVALVRPDVSVSLCESVGKRAKAVEQIVEQLQLDVPVHHCRAEQVLADHRFDTLTARALASLGKTLTWFKPHWPSIGRLLLIKGPRWVEERGESRHRGLLNDLQLRCAARYTTPDTGAKNVVLQVWPKSSTRWAS